MYIRLVISMSVLLALLVACQDNNTPLPTTRLSLVASDMIYDNKQLEVIVGFPVQLTLRNEGSLEHDFTIVTIPNEGLMEVSDNTNSMAGHDMGDMSTEPDIHIAAGAGAQGTIQFTPTAAGSYQFYCTVAGHKEAGMIGTLVVRAP